MVTSRTRECFMSSVQLVRIRKFIKLTKKEFWIIIQIRTDQNQLRCQGRHPFASWIGSSTWIVTARQDQLRKIYPNLSFQVTEVPQLLEKIFRGGVDENIRPEVWILSSRRICFSFYMALIRCGSSSLVTISGINQQRLNILKYKIQTRRAAKYSILYIKCLENN